MPKILTLKQIKDASKCMDCKTCSMYTLCSSAEMLETKGLAQTALTLYEILKRLEWSDDGHYCPICHYMKDEEHPIHSPNCELGEMLKKMEG